MLSNRNEEPGNRKPETGNASNPTPQDNDYRHGNDDNQIISKEGEQYLKEVANIEDLPDPQQNKNMDEVIKKEQGE